MATKTKTYTDEQLEEMRAAVAAADAKKADEARAAREAYSKPVRDLIGSDAYAEVLAQLNAIRDQYADDNFLSVHVNALAEIMPRLTDVVGYSFGSTAVAPVVTPDAQ